LTTSRDILEAMVRGQGPRRALVALGYAGWGAGQLEQELGQNSWLTVPVDADLLFGTPLEQRWQAAARTLGVDLAHLADYAGHASSRRGPASDSTAAAAGSASPSATPSPAAPANWGCWTCMPPARTGRGWTAGSASGAPMPWWSAIRPPSTAASSRPGRWPAASPANW